MGFREKYCRSWCGCRGAMVEPRRIRSWNSGGNRWVSGSKFIFLGVQWRPLFWIVVPSDFWGEKWADLSCVMWRDMVCLAWRGGWRYFVRILSDTVYLAPVSFMHYTTVDYLSTTLLQHSCLYAFCMMLPVFLTLGMNSQFIFTRLFWTIAFSHKYPDHYISSNMIGYY